MNDLLFQQREADFTLLLNQIIYNIVGSILLCFKQYKQTNNPNWELISDPQYPIIEVSLICRVGSHRLLDPLAQSRSTPVPPPTHRLGWVLNHPVLPSWAMDFLGGTGLDRGTSQNDAGWRALSAIRSPSSSNGLRKAVTRPEEGSGLGSSCFLELPFPGHQTPDHRLCPRNALTGQARIELSRPGPSCSCRSSWKKVEGGSHGRSCFLRRKGAGTRAAPGTGPAASPGGAPRPALAPGCGGTLRHETCWHPESVWRQLTVAFPWAKDTLCPACELGLGLVFWGWPAVVPMHALPADWSRVTGGAEVRKAGWGPGRRRRRRGSSQWLGSRAGITAPSMCPGRPPPPGVSRLRPRKQESAVHEAHRQCWRALAVLACRLACWWRLSAPRLGRPKAEGWALAGPGASLSHTFCPRASFQALLARGPRGTPQSFRCNLAVYGITSCGQSVFPSQSFTGLRPLINRTWWGQGLDPGSLLEVEQGASDSCRFNFLLKSSSQAVRWHGSPNREVVSKGFQVGPMSSDEHFWAKGLKARVGPPWAGCRGHWGKRPGPPELHLSGQGWYEKLGAGLIGGLCGRQPVSHITTLAVSLPRFRGLILSRTVTRAAVQRHGHIWLSSCVGGCDLITWASGEWRLRQQLLWESWSWPGGSWEAELWLGCCSQMEAKSPPVAPQLIPASQAPRTRADPTPWRV